MYETIETDLQDGVLTVAMNRPETHNALNETMLAELKAVFHALDQRQDVRLVVLTGNGRSFCAGADLTMMRDVIDANYEENLASSQAIFDLMAAIDGCLKPVIGRINGAALGGGVGLVSCCDIAVAVERAKFGFSEVRLGLVPAVISPFVLAKIGVSDARELFLTGERFKADKAQAIGLVHHVVQDEEQLNEKVSERVAQMLMGAPDAQQVIKTLLRTVPFQSKESMRLYTSELITERRSSGEGREGMLAFLEKRRPRWQAE